LAASFIYRMLALDDVWRIWSKRTSSADVVASLHRLPTIPIHLVQQSIRDVAWMAVIVRVVERRLRGHRGLGQGSATLRCRCTHRMLPSLTSSVMQSQQFGARRLRLGLNSEPEQHDYREGWHSSQRHRTSSKRSPPEFH